MGLIKSLLMPMIGSMLGGMGAGGLGKIISGGTQSLQQFNPINMIRQTTGMTGGGGGKPFAGSYPQMSPGGAGMSTQQQQQQQFQPIPNGYNLQKGQAEQVQQQQTQQQPIQQQSLTPLLNAIFPTTSHRITSNFGNRAAPIPGASTFHQGIDIGGQQGNPLMAALSGVIQQVGNNKGMGNYMKMLTDNGMTLTYGHANNFGVQPGQRVEAGQNVGQMGSTGISTGNHLHFMASQNGRYIDPMLLFKQRTGM